MPGLAVLCTEGSGLFYTPLGSDSRSPKTTRVYQMVSKSIHAAWFGVHFFFLTAVCLAGIFWLIAQGSTILPSVCDKYAHDAEFAATWCLGKGARPSNPFRRGIATYLHGAGIQAGYSFFAPNVPSHHRLTFELVYEDGHVEYDSPRARSKAASLRLDSLLDRLAEDRYQPVREVLVKMLAFSVWREHPEVKKLRATFWSVNPPSVTDFEQGKTETFQPMFSFDFSLRNERKQ